MAGQTIYVWCHVHPMNTTLIIIPQVAACGNLSGSQLELDQFVIPLPILNFFHMIVSESVSSVKSYFKILLEKIFIARKHPITSVVKVKE